MGGQLATEKHGDKKQAFVDLKFRTLLQKDDINQVLRLSENDHSRPWESIYNQSGEFLVPGINITADPRETIKGELRVKIQGAFELEFGDAHLVGTVSRFTFKQGGSCQLILQLRVDAGDHMDNLITMIEHGECMFEFAEYADSVKSAGNESQDELAV